MALSYGLTNPAAGMISTSTPEPTPDLFKFYTVVPTRSTESSTANKRRPVLYTSLNGGIGWNYESQNNSNAFYSVNYGGNFYFDAGNTDADHGVLMALAHKSASSSYSAYKARAGLTYPIQLGLQGWESNAVAYSTTNQPNREICKNLNGSNTSRYFCIKDGGGYAYNNTAWGTANWSITNFNSGFTLNDDGGFKHICINPEDDHAALVYSNTNDSNKYIRITYCNTDALSSVVDYTTTIFGGTAKKQNEFKYVSIDYLPDVGFLIFYAYANNNSFCVRILRTHDPVTGEKLPYNQFVQTDAVQNIGTSNNKMLAYGAHGWYCPWTKEYYFAPNAYQVFWTKDGLNWNSSATTGASTSTTCVKFMTDGQNMVVATSGSAYYRSYDKGQTWASGTSLSPNGFNTGRSNDTIVLPFKCVNNLGIDTSNLSLGYTLDSSTGQPVANAANFYANEYVPINSNTSYVVYGKNKTTNLLSYFVSIAWYDSSKNFISRSDTNSVYDVGIFTSPSNAVYARIRCNLNNTTVTQAMVDSYKWYFAKEDDFKVMTNYGDIVCN
jgi:hypothetical protein